MAQKKKSDDRSGLFIPAGLFIGMGLGFLSGQFVAGLFIGLGCGFLGMAVTWLVKKKK
ncbi:MAG: hypothetical protein ACOCWQ_05645 [Nanoarchaeota archaeon]